MRQHPTIIPSPEFFEMTRDEQMKKTWEVASKQAQINYRKNLYDIESKTYGPPNLYPGVFPYHLHYGMFNGGI